MSGRLSVKAVLHAVACVTGISVPDMLGRAQTRRITHARHVAIWMAARHCPHISRSEIGRRVGGRDHTTILAAIGKIEAAVADAGMDREMQEIELVLASVCKALAGLSIDDDDIDPLEIAGRAMTDHGLSRLTYAEIRCLAAYAIQQEESPSEQPHEQPAAEVAVPMLPGGDALIGAARRVVRAHTALQAARHGRGELTSMEILAGAVKDLHEAYLDLAAPVVFKPVSNPLERSPSMAKSARQTTRGANLPVPQSREEAMAAVSTIGMLQRDIGRIQADLDDEITRLKEAAEALSSPKQELVNTTIEGLRIWAEANRQQLTDGGRVKFADLGTGKISWRFRPASVKLRGADAIIETLRTLGLGRFVRTKEEIDREAMLREPDIARSVPGVSIGSDGEDFIVEPLSSPLSTGGADV
jgi:phage host-nuclease inhibitor protein Gam